jgi:hypothetical protein
MKGKDDCEHCGGDGQALCGNCAGSGEGMRDGARCMTCKGTGCVPCECVEGPDGPNEMDYEDMLDARDAQATKGRYGYGF